MDQPHDGENYQSSDGARPVVAEYCGEHRDDAQGGDALGDAGQKPKDHRTDEEGPVRAPGQGNQRAYHFMSFHMRA